MHKNITAIYGVICFVILMFIGLYFINDLIKPYRIKVGQKYLYGNKYNDDDPFKKYGIPDTIYIINVKDGYVQYVIKHNSHNLPNDTMSILARGFIYKHKLIKQK